MKILVAIKHVPDTETKIRIGGDGKSLDETGVKWIISPYDEFAVEEALRIRDARQGEVVAVSAGPAEAQTTLRQAMAMGADRGLLIEDGRFLRCDGLTRARALAAAVREESPDLVLLGKYGVGTDEWQTGAMLAELLDWPHSSAVCELELGDGTYTAKREVEGAAEIQEGKLPAVITCEKGLNEPRYASLKGIMQAKKKKLDVKKPADLGVDVSALQEPMVVWESMELPPPRSGAKMIEGESAEVAAELARVLREEVKVL